MAIEIKIIQYEVCEDGCLWSAIELTDQEKNKRKVMLYRVGLSYSGRPLRSRYVHEVSDIHFPEQIPEWRKIDSKRDYGFSPEVFRTLIEKLRVD
mgnify:CR=1 FL=1